MSTLPRTGTTSRPRPSARSWAARRGDPVPTLDPVGSPPRVKPSRATRQSRGSSRRGMAASSSPRAGDVGRSLSEWTARSTSPASSASRRAVTKTPTPPKDVEGRGVPVALGHDLDELDLSTVQLSDLVGDARGLGPGQGAAAGADGEECRSCPHLLRTRRAGDEVDRLGIEVEQPGAGPRHRRARPRRPRAPSSARSGRAAACPPYDGRSARAPRGPGGPGQAGGSRGEPARRRPRRTPAGVTRRPSARRERPAGRRGRRRPPRPTIRRTACDVGAVLGIGQQLTEVVERHDRAPTRGRRRAGRCRAGAPGRAAPTGGPHAQPGRRARHRG